MTATPAEALPEPLDMIAVGAHPDDVEIGCGGTLSLLSSQGCRVGIVDLTDGEPTPRSSGPEERLAEAAAAACMAGARVGRGRGASWVRADDGGAVRTSGGGYVVCVFQAGNHTGRTVTKLHVSCLNLFLLRNRVDEWCLIPHSSRPTLRRLVFRRPLRALERTAREV